MHQKKIPIAIGAVLIVLFMTACHTTRKTSVSRSLELKNSYCTPTVPYQLEVKLWEDSVETDLSNTGISEHNTLVCNTLGISKYIGELFLLKKGSTDHAVIQRLNLLQKVTARLLLAQSELQAVAAELDCEGERSDMAADYLDNLNDKRNRNFTVSSVIIGALTTVATATISNNGVQVGVGIGGGLIGAGLGALTINPKGKQIEFLHQRNLLRSIWSETASNMDYPGFVWKMLHEKKFSNKGDVTLSQSIKNRWIQFEFDGKPDGDTQKLLFGNGGFYKADDLHTRSAMINQLQSTIRSINQDLTSLILFLETM